MIKPTIINILRQPNGILDLKKGFDKAIKIIPAISEDLMRIENRVGHLNNNLILQEMFFSNSTAK